MFSIALLCTLWISTLCPISKSLRSDIHDEYSPGSLACKLWNESKLDCTRRELIVIPPISKQNATLVDFSENKIELISPKAFAGQKLLSFIDFTRNHLINITGSPFSDLSSLVCLNLSSNLISHVTSTAFRGLSKLELLDISDNKLKTIADGVFENLIGLKRLDISSNQLTQVPSVALANLCNLQTLNIMLNPFRSVTVGPEFELFTKLEEFSLFSEAVTPTLTNSTLQHLAHSPLRYVIFSWRPFIQVETGIFGTFKNITSLLAGPYGFRDNFYSVPSSVNRLILTVLGQPVITRDLFKPLANLNESLTTLSLQFLISARSTKIESFTFKWFPSLRQLNLSNFGEVEINLANNTFFGLNKLKSLALRRIMLTSIPSAAFKTFRETRSLRALDLGNYNLLGKFSPDAFASVTSIEYLDLSYNPISYLNKWIECLKNLKYLFLNGGNIQTFSQVKWKEPLYSLKELHLDHLKNEDSSAYLLMLSQKAPNLEILNVADTLNIYNITTIRNLKFLRYLDVSGSIPMLTEDNFLKQWSSVFFTNLTSLKFARNRLETMTILHLYRTTPG